jgi:copper chaperone CopZ
MAELVLKIDGMHCGACVRRVTQALSAVEGLAVSEVTVGTARIASTLEPAPIEAAIASLGKIGFTAKLES